MVTKVEERAVLLKKGLAGWVSGALAFPSVLAVTQKYLWKPLRVSFSPKWRSSVLGLASVSLASLSASSAALGAVYVIQSPNNDLGPTYSDLLVSTLTGVVLFKAVGGQYARVLPSNLMRPGAFAVDWIPALNESARATPKERQVVNYLGTKYGCHTCGVRRRASYIADHQPPSKLVRNHRTGTRTGPADPLLQRMYPQCPSCSNIQGGLLAQNGLSAVRHSKATVTHSFKLWNLRLYHLLYCLPIPLLVSYLNTTVLGAREGGEVKAGSQVKQEATERKEVAERKDDRKEVTSSDTWLGVEVISNFPLLIMWQRMVHFLDSFNDPLTTFNLTLWAFIIIAALGTI